MNSRPDMILNEMVERFPKLVNVKRDVEKAFLKIVDAYKGGGKVLVCGNGGSASDADHIVGELMKGFLLKRPLTNEIKSKLKIYHEGEILEKYLQMPLSAINLSAHSALLTALCNDTDQSVIFAQQVLGYGNEGDVLIGISTSGMSENVICAGVTAKALGLVTVGVTGESGGKMINCYDILIRVPSSITCHIQEMHRPVYHTLCSMVEAHFFDK